MVCVATALRTLEVPFNSETRLAQAAGVCWSPRCWRVEQAALRCRRWSSMASLMRFCLLLLDLLPLPGELFMNSGGVMSTYLSGGVALIRIGVVGIVPPILPSYKIKLSFLLFLEKEASIGFFCLRSLRILGGSSGFVTYPRAVHLIRSWQCYIAFAFEGYGAAFRFQFIAVRSYPLCLCLIWVCGLWSPLSVCLLR